ncbi:MAG: hypothetical protein LBI39_02450 [Puniceicoccales bacterium]|jgi:TrpR-related protein YerC/YecD|nr:hypothetical protein [Puniceicoccales bacterium]
MDDGKCSASQVEDLLRALLAMGNVETAKKFMEDLCAPAELDAMVERWRVCRILWSGKPYREISAETGASSATIARVARCLRSKSGGGYREVLENLRKNECDETS